jgi:hypothetical protein
MEYLCQGWLGGCGRKIAEWNQSTKLLRSHGGRLGPGAAVIGGITAVSAAGDEAGWAQTAQPSPKAGVT